MTLCSERISETKHNYSALVINSCALVCEIKKIFIMICNVYNLEPSLTHLYSALTES